MNDSLFYDQVVQECISVFTIDIMTSGKGHWKQIENLGLVVGNPFGRIEYA